MQFETREGKIKQLIEIAAECDGETGDVERLNRAERRFFKKYPDWVKKRFKDPKFHIRASEIVYKMKQFGLDEDDVDAVHQALINGNVVSKSSSILKGD
jgi:hypothetical protein